MNEDDEVLVASVLVEYCEVAKDALDRSEQGVHGDFVASIKGRKIGLNDIVREIDGGSQSPLGIEDKYIFFLLMFPPFFFIDFFLEIVVGELLFVGVWFFLSKESKKKKRMEYMRLRDSSEVIEAVAKMTGYANNFLSDEKEESPITKEINHIMKVLSAPGGYLTMSVIRRLRRYIKEIEGFAHLMAYSGLTVDDVREGLLGGAEGG